MQITTSKTQQQTGLNNPNEGVQGYNCFSKKSKQIEKKFSQNFSSINRISNQIQGSKKKSLISNKKIFEKNNFFNFSFKKKSEIKMVYSENYFLEQKKSNNSKSEDSREKSLETKKVSLSRTSEILQEIEKNHSPAKENLFFRTKTQNCKTFQKKFNKIGFKFSGYKLFN